MYKLFGFSLSSVFLSKMSICRRPYQSRAGYQHVWWLWHAKVNPSICKGKSWLDIEKPPWCAANRVLHIWLGIPRFFQYWWSAQTPFQKHPKYFLPPAPPLQLDSKKNCSIISEETNSESGNPVAYRWKQPLFSCFVEHELQRFHCKDKHHWW